MSAFDKHSCPLYALVGSCTDKTVVRTWHILQWLCVWFCNLTISYCSFRRIEMVAITPQYILIRLSTLKLHNWLLFSFYGSSCDIYRSSFAWNTATGCSKLASSLYFGVLYLFLCSRSSSASYIYRESTQALCYTPGSDSCRRKIYSVHNNSS